MNNNDKIKEAFEKWVNTDHATEQKTYANGGLGYYLRLGFRGGYTSRDEEVAMLKTVIDQAGSNGMALLSEIEQLKKDKRELLSMVMELRNDSEELLREYQTSRLREVVLLEQEKRVKNADSLIERMKGF